MRGRSLIGDEPEPQPVAPVQQPGPLSAPPAGTAFAPPPGQQMQPPGQTYPPPAGPAYPQPTGHPGGPAHPNATGQQQGGAYEPPAGAAPPQRMSLTGEPYTPQQPTMQMAPPVMNRRVSLTGEVVDATQAMPPQFAPAAPLGPHPAYQAGPYAQAPATHPGGPVLPPSAYSVAAIRDMAAADQPSAGERWEKGLAIALPIIALSMLLIRFAPASLFVVLFANLLVVPAVFGAVGAIPRYEDAHVDCAIMLVVTMLLGPIVALVAYLLVSAIKQEINLAIVVILGANLLIRTLFGIAFAPSADTMSIVLMWGIFGIFSFFGVCVSFIGWLCSSFFRGLNE